MSLPMPRILGRSLPFSLAGRSLVGRRTNASQHSIQSYIRTNGLCPPPIAIVHACTHRYMSTKTVPITYIEADGTEKTVEAEIGKNLLEVAHDNNIELEGACGGELACSTCHLIFLDKEFYDTLPEKEDDEDDMLDLAFEVTETSRLGCQIKVREDFSGIKVRIPDDGF